MKFWLGVGFAFLSFSPATETTTEYQTVVREVQAEYREPEPTPILDSLIDLEERERQSLCLWDYIQANDIEITLYNVLTAGDYTDMMGGACYLMGVDDVPME